MLCWQGVRIHFVGVWYVDELYHTSLNSLSCLLSGARWLLWATTCLVSHASSLFIHLVCASRESCNYTSLPTAKRMAHSGTHQTSKCCPPLDLLQASCRHPSNTLLSVCLHRPIQSAVGRIFVENESTSNQVPSRVHYRQRSLDARVARANGRRHTRIARSDKIYAAQAQSLLGAWP